MHDLELNKILAACLVAGIIASASGFVAKKIVHPHDVKASGAEASGDAGAAPEAPQQPDPILDLIAKADANHGKALAQACASCHTFDNGGHNGVGPNLWDVLNRGRAAKADFSYSDDMAKRKGQKWTYEDLNHFIWTPKSFVPGTKMTFPGYKKAQDRADVIAFLRTLTDSPPALPSAADIAAEKKELGPKEAAPAPGKDAGKGADKGAKTAPATDKTNGKTGDKKSDGKKSGDKATKDKVAAKPEKSPDAAAPVPAAASAPADAAKPDNTDGDVDKDKGANGQVPSPPPEE